MPVMAKVVGWIPCLLERLCCHLLVTANSEVPQQGELAVHRHGLNPSASRGKAHEATGCSPYPTFRQCGNPQRYTSYQWPTHHGITVLCTELRYSLWFVFRPFPPPLSEGMGKRKRGGRPKSAAEERKE